MQPDCLVAEGARPFRAVRLALALGADVAASEGMQKIVIFAGIVIFLIRQCLSGDNPTMRIVIGDGLGAGAGGDDGVTIPDLA